MRGEVEMERRRRSGGRREERGGEGEEEGSLVHLTVCYCLFEYVHISVNSQGFYLIAVLYYQQRASRASPMSCV